MANRWENIGNSSRLFWGAWKSLQVMAASMNLKRIYDLATGVAPQPPICLASQSLSSPALGPSLLGRGFSSGPSPALPGEARNAAGRPSGKQTKTARAGCSLLPPCGGEGWRGDLGYLVGPECWLSSPLQVGSAGLKPTSPEFQTCA